MYRYLRHFGLFSMLTLGISLNAYATLINESGAINHLDLRWGKTESNSLQAFNEQQNLYISENAVKVDYLVGTNLFFGQTFNGVNKSKSGLYLGAGSYNSHLIHFDPLGTRTGQVKDQRFNFEESIVAIILGGEYLNASDLIFGSATTRYENSFSRKMEKHDFLYLENPYTLLLDKVSVGRYWIDDVRVITHNVPEPSSWGLFGLGLLSLVCARKLIHK